MFPFFTRIYNYQFAQKKTGMISTAAKLRLIANIYSVLSI